MSQPTALELADEFRDEHNEWNEDNLRNWGMDAQITLRKQQKEIDTLKDQLKIVSNNLRNGISKSIQKAQAKAIEETLDECDWKRTREYCS